MCGLRLNFVCWIDVNPYCPVLSQTKLINFKQLKLMLKVNYESMKTPKKKIMSKHPELFETN